MTGMKSPAFRFYPSDFITGTDHMGSDEVGLYMRLLCYEWLKGGLPDNELQLSRLGRWEKPSDFPESVRTKFVKCEDGLLRNVRLEEERVKQEKHSAIQRSNVVEGRWKKDSKRANSRTTPAQPGPQSPAVQNGQFSVEELLKICGAVYKRPEGQRPTYAEEVAAAEVVRRENWKREADEIVGLKTKMEQKGEGKFFPNSMGSLLQNWSPTLDKARNYKSKSKGPNL